MPEPLVIRRIVLVDDDAAVLESLDAVFTSAGYEVHSFTSATAFLERIESLQPACIVTDLRMPDIDGLSLVSLLQGRREAFWPVVFISGHADVPDAVAAIRAGAVDFLTKPFAPRQLLEIVEDCVTGLRPDGAASLAERYAALSPREREVVESLLRGETSNTAALQLGISPRTVDILRGRLLRKTGANNVTALAKALSGLGPNIPQGRKPH